jgi:hypothetical protein
VPSVPILQRVVRIILETLIVRADFRLTQVAFDESIMWTSDGAFGSALSMADAKG